MAGGPIYPSSAYINDTSGQLFPGFYTGGGGNASPTEEGWQVAASLATSDPVLELRFPVPPTVPSGTLKLRCLALANASSGNALFTVSDKNVAAGASPSAATLNAETQTTITWGAGDADKYKEAKITLTSAPAGNDQLVLAVTFNHTSWTLAANGTFLFSIIWE